MRVKEPVFRGDKKFVGADNALADNPMVPRVRRPKKIRAGRKHNIAVDGESRERKASKA